MANKIQEAFDSIKAQPQLTESTKQFISEKYRKKTWLFYKPALNKAFAVVCMALAVVLGIGGYSWFQTPVSYLSIDINPSIELALNRFDRVVSMAAYNAQGAKILENLPLRGKKYTDAIDLIVENKAMHAYLTDESELVFTVAAASSRESELKSGLERCSRHIAANCQSISANIGIVSQAHGYGLSFGKYYAYLQLAQYDDTVTVDECRNMGISEIHGLIREHEQGGDHCQEGEQEEPDESSVDGTSTGSQPNGHHQYRHRQNGHHQ